MIGKRLWGVTRSLAFSGQRGQVDENIAVHGDGWLAIGRSAGGSVRAAGASC